MVSTEPEKFPSAQDIRTHKSVAAKRAKHEGVDSPERLAITTPAALAEAIIREARVEYRRGTRVVQFHIRFRSTNLHVWGERSGLLGANPTRRDLLMMYQRFHGVTRNELGQRLGTGTFLKSFEYDPHPTDEIIFWGTISVINPSS